MHKKIIFKNPQQIADIKESWKYLNELLTNLKQIVKPWINLLELEQYAQDFLNQNNLKWAFKWYQWYPANLCLSVNDCVVHWIPNDYKLKDKDLLKIDVWVVYNWLISDAAISIVLWNNFKAQKLVDATKWWLDNAMKKIWPWKSIYDFGLEVFDYINKTWFCVIKNLTWHWVWVHVHEWPYIFNYPSPDGKWVFFQPGMVVALEPITAIKSQKVFEKPWNHWNLYTQYWDLWAQREYTIVITENWYEVLAGLE